MDEKYRIEIRERILKVLTSEHIVSILETSQKAKTQRVTAKKHLERLTREGVTVEMRKGSARLFILAQRMEEGGADA